jgi:hypothetical protein
MATKAKEREDAGLAPPRVLADYVAVAAQFGELEKSMQTLRQGVDAGGKNNRIRYATMATTLMASDLVARLVKMMVTLAGEE